MTERQVPTSFQIDQLFEEARLAAQQKKQEEGKVAALKTQPRLPRGDEWKRYGAPVRGKNYGLNSAVSETRPDLFENKLANSGSRRGSLVGSHDGSRSNRSSNGVNEESEGSSADKDSRPNGNRHRSRSPRRERDDRKDRRHRDRSQDDHRRGTDSYRSRRDDGHHQRDNYRPDRRRDDRDIDQPRHQDDRPSRNRPGNGLSANEVRTEPAQAQLSDDQRDERTVFVTQLAGQLRSKNFKAFFEQVGPVREVQIVKDRVSGRSKGVGYVEFEDIESVEKSLKLTGHKLMDVPIIVHLTEAEKNRVARQTQSTQPNGQPFHRLYVGNVHFSATEDDLKDIFESFGPTEFVQLQKDEHGRSKGYGFVQYTESSNAKKALENLQNFELAGRVIRVGLGTDRYSADSTQTMQERYGIPQRGSESSGLGGRGQHAGGTANFDRAGGRDGDKAGGASALDDSDVMGVNYHNYSRDSLMKKLARTEEPTAKGGSAKQVKKAPAPAAQATRCILVKNVWTSADTTESNWQKELEDDFRTECSSSYGPVVHVGIDTGSMQGEVYVKFDSTKSALKAYQGLQGRSFDRRLLTADYVVDAIYNSLFPKAAKL